MTDAPIFETHHQFLDRMEQKFAAYRPGTAFDGRPFSPGRNVAFGQTEDADGNFVEVLIDLDAVHARSNERYARVLDVNGQTAPYISGQAHFRAENAGKPKVKVDGIVRRVNNDGTPRASADVNADLFGADFRRYPTVLAERTGRALSRLTRMVGNGYSPATPRALECLKPNPNATPAERAERRRNGLPG